jgi:hypothetical protein
MIKPKLTFLFDFYENKFNILKIFVKYFDFRVKTPQTNINAR